MRLVFILKHGFYKGKNHFSHGIELQQTRTSSYFLSSFPLSIFVRPLSICQSPSLYRQVFYPYPPSCPTPNEILKDTFPLLYWVPPFFILKQDFWGVFIVQIVSYVFNVAKVWWSSPHQWGGKDLCYSYLFGRPPEVISGHTVDYLCSLPHIRICQMQCIINFAGTIRKDSLRFLYR